MKYLVLNGSPKGKKSVTMIVTNALLEGIRDVDSMADIYISNLSECKIIPCRSCYACWSHISEGECIMTSRKVDDMPKLMEKYYSAEKIIISTPMHFFNVSSYLQKFFERTLPLIKSVYLPKQCEFPEEKYEMSHKDMVVCTCKREFPGVWDCIDAQMNFLSQGKYQALFSTQPLPASVEEKKIVTDYLNEVTQAGREFASNGKFCEQTLEKLQEKEKLMAKYIDTCNVGL